jgi:hypothetical protein
VDFFYTTLSLLIAVLIYFYILYLQFGSFANSCDHRCDMHYVILTSYYFQAVVMEYKSDNDSYDGEVEDTSVDEYSSDTSTSEAEIRLRFTHFC